MGIDPKITPPDEAAEADPWATLPDFPHTLGNALRVMVATLVLVPVTARADALMERAPWLLPLGGRALVLWLLRRYAYTLPFEISEAFITQWRLGVNAGGQRFTVQRRTHRHWWGRRRVVATIVYEPDQPGEGKAQ